MISFSIFSHPKNVCMTYLEHMGVALQISATFFVGSLVAFIHAFIPDIFVNTPSQLNQHVTYIITKNGCR